MASVKQEKLYALLDTIEEYEDAVTYGKKWDKFDRVVSSKKQALVNFDTEEGLFIKEFKAFRRALVNAGVASALKIFSPSKKSIQKGISYDQYSRWKKDLDAKIPQIERDFNNKLIVPITASYGKGFDRGMEDLGYKPKDEWMYLPGHAVPRLTNLRLVNYISNSLSIDMTAVVVEGMRDGKNGRDIARGLRDLINAPKKIDVKPKYDTAGVLKRRGYQYEISIKRYSEMIGRTEVNRATNLGRLDSYKQSGLVKSVVFITAGDDRVCPECEAFLDKVVPISQAFTIIPVHVMCRCTWEAYEYKTDADSKAEGALAYQADDMDKVVNTSPMGLPRQNLTAGVERYKKHLAAKGINNAEGYEKVYNKLYDQLVDRTNVFELSGWDPKKVEHLYALHNIKNARMVMLRDASLAPRLMKNSTSYVYEPTIRGKSTTLAATDVRAKMGTRNTYVSSSGVRGTRSQEDFYRTIYHEAGHNVYYDTLTTVEKDTWKMLYEISDKREFVSSYAKTTLDEDFAESFAAYMKNSSSLKRVSETKHAFIDETVFGNI